MLLNLAEDHLDRHGTFEAYRDAKLQIFARQPPDGVAVASRSASGSSRSAAARARVTFGAGAGADLAERDGRLVLARRRR